MLPGQGSWFQPSWTGTGRALLRWTQFNRLLLTGLGWFTGVCPEIWPSMLSLLILSLTSLLLLWNPPTSIAGYFWRRKPHACQKATALNLLPQRAAWLSHTRQVLCAAPHLTLGCLWQGRHQPSACDSNNRGVTGRAHTDLVSSSFAAW